MMFIFAALFFTVVSSTYVDTYQLFSDENCANALGVVTMKYTDVQACTPVSGAYLQMQTDSGTWQRIVGYIAWITQVQRQRLFRQFW